MIKRYTLKSMDDLWQDKVKFSYWLKVELAVLFARMKLGEISSKCYKAIKKNAAFSLKRISELEAKFQHDMIAFVECVKESLREKGVPGEWADQFHRGLTSYDIEDPALMLILLKAGKLILKELINLEQALQTKAREHQWTLMIARTHGQAAEPTTFGLLLLVYADEIRTAILRLETIMEELCFGKMSGAVGTYAGMNPKIEEIACKKLGLKPAPIATQILQRDRIASFLAALALVGSVIEQMARTFWEMMRFEVGELEEPRKATQRGSSAMPQKKNPILTERLQGLSRLLRVYLQVALENIATPEHRDISQSGPERIILPDATILAHYMIAKMTELIKGMTVFPEKMEKNLKATQGTWTGQRIRYALVKAGIPDDKAYQIVQQASFIAIAEGKHLADVLANMPISESDLRKVIELLPNLSELLDPLAYIKEGVETIFSRF